MKEGWVGSKGRVYALIPRLFLWVRFDADENTSCIEFCVRERVVVYVREILEALALGACVFIRWMNTFVIG